MHRVFLGNEFRACACALFVGACGPESANGDGAEGSGDATGDDTNEGSGSDAGGDDMPSDESSADDSTGEVPIPPVCTDVVCGDGIVGLDEPCDDANGDDADGCTAQCVRTEPTPIVAMERAAQAAAFDADGSVVVVESGDDPRLVRLAPDGTEIWAATIETSSSVGAEALLLGAEIVLVGNRSVSEEWVGATWRFAPDGTRNGRVDDAGGRYYLDADLAENGDTAVLMGSLQTFGDAVERRAPDGTQVWIQEDIGNGMFAWQSIAFVSDDRVIAVGGAAGQAIVAYVTAEEATTFSSVDYPDMYFYEVVADATGGAIAAADASGQLVLASIAAPGDPAETWVSTCSVTTAAALGIAVSDDRILVYGKRWLPEPGCGDVCSGAYASWVQHFALDGTVVAHDVAESLDPENQYPFETALAVRRDEAGDVIALVSGQVSTSYLARFPR
jgi:cysteine-rich repeat protein